MSRARPFHPEKLALQALWHRMHDNPEAAERLEAVLQAEHRCKACGRHLSDPVSIERGVGSDCWAKGRR